MMVIMQEGATDEHIARVVPRIEEVGASAHVSHGERVAVIGAIGDREELPAAARGPSRRRPGGRHPQAVQAGRPRVPPADTVVEVRGKRSAAGLRHDRRPLLGRDRRADHGGRARGRGSRRARCCAAARSSRAPRPTPSRASARKACRSARPRRATRPACRSSPSSMDPRDLDDLLALRRRRPDRGAQHAELPAARRASAAADQARPAQARPGGHDRGAADGGRVHRQRRQPNVILCERGIRTFETGRATRSTSRRPVVRLPVTCRSWSIRATPPGAPTWCCRCRWPRLPPAPTACSSRPTRIPSTPSPTALSRCRPSPLPSTPNGSPSSWPGPARASPSAAR